MFLYLKWDAFTFQILARIFFCQSSSCDPSLTSKLNFIYLIPWSRAENPVTWGSDLRRFLEERASEQAWEVLGVSRSAMKVGSTLSWHYSADLASKQGSVRIFAHGYTGKIFLVRLMSSLFRGLVMNKLTLRPASQPNDQLGGWVAIARRALGPHP